MSDIFPKWANKLPSRILTGGLVVGATLAVGAWYYLTPKYARVGYQPTQPVAFSHAIHSDQLGIDCRYCHDDVEKSWYSNIPAASTCMNCHNQVLGNDARLSLVRESFQTDKPIPWVQIHKTPDYVYFNHAVHVNRGVSCVECHGPLNKMDEVFHAKPLSMAFCLDCHENPSAKLRPPDKVTDLDWKWSEDPKAASELQKLHGPQLQKDWNVESLRTCSACHR